MHENPNFDDDLSWHRRIRGMKKAEVRALFELPPMSDDDVRAALKEFSSGLREMGLTGSESPAAEYRDSRRRRAAPNN